MIKYTVIANEDGRESEQVISSRRPLDTLDVRPVNELVAPDPDKDYFDVIRESAAASGGGDLIRVDFSKYEQPENPEAA